MASFPASPLETEASLLIGSLIQKSGYQLEVTPRLKGADLAAERHGTVWATFHVDVDPQRPLFLRIGATVWSGARVESGLDIAWDAPADPRLEQFVHARLELACKRGRAENSDHCAHCPLPGHRVL